VKNVDFRQGDVAIGEPMDAVPDGAKLVPLEGGRIILAHGEVTGHSHAVVAAEPPVQDINEEFARLYELEGRRYLHALKPVTIVHEEHEKIDVPASIREITIQREWTPEAIRNVAD
jgi:hypothetical protein